MMNTASSPLEQYQNPMAHTGDMNYPLLMQSYYGGDGYPAHAGQRPAGMDQMPMSDGLGPMPPMTPGLQVSVPVVGDLQSHSFVDNGRRYELVVMQQPRRARMCGFGDKDRRPITPPPCVRLIITDAVTGVEIDCNDIDHGMFVLNVDLWSQDGTREVNLVRHSASSPSISSTSLANFTEVAQSAATFTNTAMANNRPYSSAAPQFKFEAGPNQASPFQAPASFSPYPTPMQVGSYPQQPPHPQYADMSYQQPFAPMPNEHGFPQNGFQDELPAYYDPQTVHSQFQGVNPMEYGMPQQQFLGQPGFPNYDGLYQQNEQEPQRMPIPQTQPGGMFTRNLIGSLAASAFRLTDPDDRIGIWFVLQDLSVRTEGCFRLRFSFVNVGAPTGSGTPDSDTAASLTQSGAINTGRAPVLASCFSEVFTVYSAKKFPGVVESTALSKCFATQGIKIPIRKDGPGGKGRDREEYDED